MKVKDPRYDYNITVSAHFILEDKGKILVAKRPDTWEWAPGRWSLVGGKLYKDESFAEGIKRKTKQELGFEVEPKGLYQIKQLVIKGKQAFMYFFVGDYEGQDIKGEMQDYKWIGQKEVKSMDSQVFAEFFYRDMFSSYLGGDKEVSPMSSIESLNYIKLDETDDYKHWFEGIVEETGIKVSVGKLLDVTEDFFTHDEGDAHGVLIYYEVQSEGGKLLVNGNNDDTGEVKYMKLTDLNKSNVQRVYWEFMKKLKKNKFS